MSNFYIIDIFFEIQFKSHFLYFIRKRRFAHKLAVFNRYTRKTANCNNPRTTL